MMQALKIIWKDVEQLVQVCGLKCALRWLAKIAATIDECRKVGNLQPADVAMGEGPFLVHLRGAKAKLVGRQVFSGIREIWARDCYLGRGYLQIPPDAVVVDLGANMGNFTNLALGHYPSVRVIAVEPSHVLNEKFKRSVGINEWLDRVTLQRYFYWGNDRATNKIIITSLLHRCYNCLT